LISPSGSKVSLRSRSGSSERNWAGWYGVDLPFSSSSLLAQFIGERGAGEWTLHVSDHAPGDTGELDEWALRLTGYDLTPLVSKK